MHPTPGMIKLNMSCAASNSYLTLLPYYHDESKFDITESDIPKMLKDMKETPMRHLIMTIFNSRKSGRHPGLGVDIYCYYCNICLNTFGIGINSCLLHIQEICQGILQVSQKQRKNNRSTCSVKCCISLYWGQR